MKRMAVVVSIFCLLVLASTFALAEEQEREVSEKVVSDEVAERERHTHTRLFPIVNYARHGDDTKLKVIHVPGAAVVKAKHEGGDHSVSVVDVPLFSLAENDYSDDGTFDRKFVKLPIIGALFRHQRTEERERVRFLFFRHTRAIDDKRSDD